jgi:sugar/nucleoside kinase (ribokinase family)
LVPVQNITGGRDAFWSALLVARLDDKPWSLAVAFAHEVAALKLRIVGHVERAIDREVLYQKLERQLAGHGV